MNKIIILNLLILTIFVIGASRVYGNEHGFDEDSGEIEDGGTLPSSYSGDFVCLGICRLEWGGYISGSGIQDGNLITISSGTLIIDSKVTSGNFEYDFSAHSYAIIDGTHQFILISQATIKDTPAGFEGISTGEPTLVDGIEIEPIGTHFTYPPKETERGITIKTDESGARIDLGDTPIGLVGDNKGEGAADVDPDGEIITSDTTAYFNRHGKSIVVNPDGSETTTDLSNPDETKITTTTGSIHIDDITKDGNTLHFKFKGRDKFGKNVLTIGKNVLGIRGGWEWNVYDQKSNTNIDGVTGVFYKNSPYPGFTEFTLGDILTIDGENTLGIIYPKNGGFFTARGINREIGSIGRILSQNNIYFSSPPSENLKLDLFGELPEINEKIWKWSGLLKSKTHELEESIIEGLNPRGYLLDTRKGTARNEHSSGVDLDEETHTSTASDEFQFYFGPQLSIDHEALEQISLGRIPEEIGPTISLGGGLRGDIISSKFTVTNVIGPETEWELELELGERYMLEFEAPLNDLRGGELTVGIGNFEFITPVKEFEPTVRYTVDWLDKLGKSRVTFFGGYGNGIEEGHGEGGVGMPELHEEQKIREEYFAGLVFSYSWK